MQQAKPQPEQAAQNPWASKLGQTVTVEGQASNAKLGAIVGAEPAPIWIDGLDAWPEEVAWKRVQVTGTVIERHDLPVFVRKEGEPEMAGMPVPPGTDLHAASRRFLLKDARWKRID